MSGSGSYDIMNSRKNIIISSKKYLMLLIK